MFEKRVNIFAGHFGSGKTEVAVNYTLQMAEKGFKTAVVDLDIVNPYFRTTDAKSALEEKGIRVVTPMYANTNVDVPALPPEINTLFEKKEYKVVLDVGGDDLGARVLARYKEDILSDSYEMFFVINARRPMTDSLPKILEMISVIEDSARLKVTRLVNNTNLLQGTTTGMILEGQTLVEEASQKLGIPVGFISGFHEPLKEIEPQLNTEFLYMRKLIKLPWD